VFFKQHRPLVVMAKDTCLERRSNKLFTSRCIEEEREIILDRPPTQSTNPITCIEKSKTVGSALKTENATSAWRTAASSW